MRAQKATHLALTLLLAAASGVFAVPAYARSAAQKKASTSGSAHRRKSTRRVSRRERGQKAPTPERISEIQQALAKDGSYSGTPNGKWDASTAEALGKSQEAHGLNPTGKLDAKTLQQLGLGSSVAGVAAPLPPTSSSLQKAKPPQPGLRQPQS